MQVLVGCGSSTSLSESISSEQTNNTSVVSVDELSARFDSQEDETTNSLEVSGLKVTSKRELKSISASYKAESGTTKVSVNDSRLSRKGLDKVVVRRYEVVATENGKILVDESTETLIKKSNSFNITFEDTNVTLAKVYVYFVKYNYQISKLKTVYKGWSDIVVTSPKNEIKVANYASKPADVSALQLASSETPENLGSFKDPEFTIYFNNEGGDEIVSITLDDIYFDSTGTPNFTADFNNNGAPLTLTLPVGYAKEDIIQVDFSFLLCLPSIPEGTPMKMNNRWFEVPEDTLYVDLVRLR